MLTSNELGNLSDRDLLAVSRAYEAKITADGASLNLGAGEATAIKDANDEFEAALDQWDAVQAQEAAISAAKKSGRKTVLSELRGQRKMLYADPDVSESARAAAGLPPLDKTKTASSVPSTAPLGWVDYGKLKHTIHFRDSATPDSKAKPDGMLGCEIWHFIGTSAPVSEKDYRYLATDTSSPYTVDYEMTDAGKKVFYQLRWLSKSGERGEWSQTVEATVNG